MPASESTKVQVNFKTPGGTLVNIYAATSEELPLFLEYIEGLAPQIAALEGVLSGASNAASISAPPTQQAAPVAPPAPPAAPPRPAGPTTAAPQCAHGPRVHKSGTSKAGKPYAAWFCPSRDRNDQCSPVWAD